MIINKSFLIKELDVSPHSIIPHQYLKQTRSFEVFGRDLIVFSEAKYFYTLVTSSFQTPIVGYVKQISDFLESSKFPIDRWCDRSYLKSYAFLNNFTSYRYEYFLYYACANPHIEGLKLIEKASANPSR